MPTLQIRIDADEYEALQKLAEGESVSISEFCRQAIRLGVASEQLAAIQTASQARRNVDREEHRKAFNLITQCALILHELADRKGIDTDAIRADAEEHTAEHFTKGDALEQALDEMANEFRAKD